MAVDYSVIIPAFNEEVLLPRTLDHLSRAMQTVQSFRGEVIVVDNNSTDGTAAAARAGGAAVVFEPVNQISRARNRGAEAAGGRFLIFVDADTAIGGRLLAAALAALSSGAVCGGGAHVTSSDSTAGPLAAAGMGLWNAISRFCGYAAGAFVYCRRDAWEAVGGFSTALYASEEIAFSKAVARWGRQHGMQFRILAESFDTSMRKVDWFGLRGLARLTVPILFMPWRLRSRRHCGLWYQRPQAGPAEHAPTPGRPAGKDTP